MPLTPTEQFTKTTLEHAVLVQTEEPVSGILVFTGVGRLVESRSAADLGLVVSGSLGSAAYANTSDFDAAGSAASAESAAKAYADGLVIGLWDDRGNFSAASGAWPSTGGSGTAGAILKGDTWTINVAGTISGIALDIGDTIRALQDSPTLSAHWAVQEHNLGYTPENSTNKVRTTDQSTLTGSNTDTQYPSAKLTYDSITAALASLKYAPNNITTSTALTGAAFTANSEKLNVLLPTTNLTVTIDTPTALGVTVGHSTNFVLGNALPTGTTTQLSLSGTVKGGTTSFLNAGQVKTLIALDATTWLICG